MFTIATFTVTSLTLISCNKPSGKDDDMGKLAVLPLVPKPIPQKIDVVTCPDVNCTGTVTGTGTSPTTGTATGTGTNVSNSHGSLFNYSTDGQTGIYSSNSADITISAQGEIIDRNATIFVNVNNSQINNTVYVTVNGNDKGSFQLVSYGQGLTTKTLVIPLEQEGDNTIQLYYYKDGERTNDNKNVVHLIPLLIWADWQNPLVSFTHSRSIVKDPFVDFKFNVRETTALPGNVVTRLYLDNIVSPMQTFTGIGDFSINIPVTMDGSHSITLVTSDGLRTSTVNFSFYRKLIATVCTTTNAEELAYVKDSVALAKINCSGPALVTIKKQGVSDTQTVSIGENETKIVALDSTLAGNNKYDLFWTDSITAEQRQGLFTVSSWKLKTWTQTKKIESQGFCINLWIFNACFIGPDIYDNLSYVNISRDSANISYSGGAYCIAGDAYVRDQQGSTTLISANSFQQNLHAWTAVSQGNCWAEATQTITGWTNTP